MKRHLAANRDRRLGNLWYERQIPEDAFDGKKCHYNPNLPRNAPKQTVAGAFSDG